MFAREHKLTARPGVTATALFIGGFFGPLQKLEYVGINLYTTLNKIGIAKLPLAVKSFTAVLNALVWTNLF
ncbi:MAG: hypothetical protein H6661_05245 [Ardenticatenaceae bacterium]|nr:hypothetical protein [Ardenticatenaceae bacterium]